MKLVLFINSLAGGGAERVITKLANHWAEQGHHITLVTLALPTDGDYETHASIERLSLDASVLSRNALHAVMNNARRVARLRRVLRRIQPDCIIAFMSTANVLAVLASVGLGIPVIGSERTHLDNAGLGRARQLTQRLTFRFAATIVALTEDSASWIRENLKCPVTVIPNSVALPLPRGEPRVDPDDYLQPDARVVLCVGRLVREKLMGDLIEIFARTRPNETWTLVVIGSGEEKTDLLAKVSELDLADRFIHIEQAGNIQDWYERADIYAMTSQHEGFPNALLEAIACGCPTLAYDCRTGPRELIEDGCNGYLVPVYDQAQFQERLEALMGDSALRARFGASARNVADRFSDHVAFTAWDATVASATQ
jgi:glycosyltransferase involved in cell wall biosynthesis